MIRPELKPWIEPGAALLLGLFGLWLIWLGGWVLWPLGAAVVFVALAWGGFALRRLAFQRPVDAPGLVEVDEGALRYFGARTLGGQVALRDLTELRLLRLNGQPHWRLKTRDEALLIPVAAKGAEALPDAFTALPGFSMGAASAALARRDLAVQTIWQRDAGMT